MVLQSGLYLCLNKKNNMPLFSLFLSLLAFLAIIFAICRSFYQQNVQAGIGWFVALLWFILYHLQYIN